MRQTDDGKAWSPTDLLGCPLDWVAATAAKPFTMHSASHALRPWSASGMVCRVARGCLDCNWEARLKRLPAQSGLRSTTVNGDLKFTRPGV